MNGDVGKQTSESYAGETTLVGAETNIYDRALDVSIGLSICTFLLGLVTLVKLVALDATGGELLALLGRLLAAGVGAIGAVALLSWLNVTPIASRRVRGIGIGLLGALFGLTVLGALLPVTLATVLGLALLVEAGVVLSAGLASRYGVVDTAPSASAGLVAGCAFGLVGVVIGAAFGGGLVGPLTVVGGLGLAAVAVFPREDLGSALPVAILVGGVGALIASGTIGLGWVWSPGPAVDGDLTGQVAVPLLALLGSVVAGWGAAKGRAGYGARGRQYGAFLVVYLNAALMVAIMVSIVSFVAMKGLAYALHGFTIGALSALAVLAPLLAVVLSWARTPAGTEEWHSGARQFLRAVPVAVLGGLVGLLAVVQVTGESVDAPFTYTVWVNREPQVLDTAFSITSDPTVGTLLVIGSGLFLAWYARRRAGSLRGVGPHSARLAALERGLGVAVGVAAILVALLVVPLPTVAGLPLDLLGVAAGVLALPAVVLASLGAVALAGLALGSLLVGGDGGIAERAVQRSQHVRVGLYGGFGLLVAAVLLEPTGAVSPTVGSIAVVPAVATVASVASLCLSVLTAFAARGQRGEPGRVLRSQSALGAAGAAAFLVVAALHVALTGADFAIGPITIGYTGTLSWPMTMHGYIPLGAEPGGIMPAVVGTVWIVVGASLFAVPLGVGAAVFLTEYAEQGRLTALVEVATNALWSTPSIVFGLFGATFLIPRLGGDESLLAAMLVLGFMLLPLVLITSREALKSVPDEYRDASAALGVNRWETIRSVVLPAALPGVITGGILGIGRIAGETAPLILVLGGTLNASQAVDVLGGFRFTGQPPFVSNPALLESAAALPTQVWGIIAAGVSGSPSMGWATALVLLCVVLSFYAVGILARTFFRRKLDYE